MRPFLVFVLPSPLVSHKYLLHAHGVISVDIELSRTKVDLHGCQVNVEMPAFRRHSGGILPAFCRQNDVLPAFRRHSAGLDCRKFQLFGQQKSSRCPRGAPPYPLKQFKVCAVSCSATPAFTIRAQMHDIKEDVAFK